jgi:DNA-binding transcriptional MerR regulator
MKKESDQIITLSEESKILGCHPNTLRKWDNSGFLKALRFGPRKDRRYRKQDILMVLNERKG